MHVDPDFFVCVVPHALVLLMESIESATHDVVESLWWRALQLDPLTLFDKLEYVGSGANAIRHSTGGISGETKQRYDGRPLREQLWVLPRLLVQLLCFLLDDGRD